MRVVGVTGKYCAGKSTVAEILEAHGYTQIDVDRFGHQALQTEWRQVAERFGADVVRADGEIDRAALGRIVFSNEEALADLESILHPSMVRMVEAHIAEIRSNRPDAQVCVNAAILFKMGLDRLCDTVIWVDAPVLQRIRRARERDRLPWHQLLRRVYTQRALRPPFRARGNTQQKSQGAEILSVRNDGTRDALIRRLSKIVPLE